MPKVSINIDADDLEKGVAFYVAAVGLAAVRRLGDFTVELSGAAAKPSASDDLQMQLFTSPAAAPAPGSSSILAPTGSHP